MSFIQQNNIPFAFAVGRGNVSNFSAINKFGFNPTCSTSFELISVASANVTYPTSAGAVTVVSSSTADDAAGTGARTVKIEGLDANYDIQSETVTMDGTTNVVTTNTYIRLNRMTVLTAGTGGKNAGNITATIGGNEQVRISSDYDNQSLIATYTIPRKHQGLLIRSQFTSTKDNKAMMGGIFVREESGVFQIKNTIELYRNNVVIDFPAPIIIPAKADIELRGKNLGSGDSAMGATMDIILEKTEQS